MDAFRSIHSKLKKISLNSLTLEKKPLDPKKSGSKMMTLPKKWLDNNNVDLDILLLKTEEAPKILLLTTVDTPIRELRNQVESMKEQLDKADKLKIS